VAKLQEHQKVPQPAEIPQDFIDGHKLNFDRIEEVLGVNTGENLGELLRYLYFTEPELNYRINVSILRVAIQIANDKVHLPVVPPDYHESAWMAADNECERCPGSIVIEHFPGVFGPQCLNHNRAEKYEDCLKYRENLEAHKVTDEEIENATVLVSKQLQSLVEESRKAIVINDLDTEDFQALRVVKRLAGESVS